MSRKIIHTLVLISIISCTDKDKVQPDNHNLVLKKSIVENIDAFEITNTGLEIFRNQRDLPMGESVVKLKMNASNSDLIFYWYDNIVYNEFNHKRFFPFVDCTEVWFEDTKYINDQVDSLLSTLGGIDQIISDRRFAKLEYSHHLPTFCSEYHIKNPKIGFTRLVFQRMVESGSRIDTTFESKFVLLNQLVYLDLLHKSFISEKDTVYLVNRKTEKVRRKRMCDAEVQSYLEYWK